VTLPISSGSRFWNRILDLNQIKSPRAQTIVRVVQTLLRISRSGGGQLPNRGAKRVATKKGIVAQAMVGWTVGF
jgi:hypothetical protein